MRVFNRPGASRANTGHEMHLPKWTAVAVASALAVVIAGAGWWVLSPNSKAGPKAGPAQTAAALSGEQLVNEWHLQNGICRGSSGESPATLAACERRSALDAKLEASGWCYGRPGQHGYEMKWERCASRPQVQEVDASAAQEEQIGDPRPEFDVSWVKTKEDAVKASKEAACFQTIVPVEVVQKIDATTFLGYTRFSVGSSLPILLVYQDDRTPTTSGRTLLSPRLGLAFSGVEDVPMASGFDSKVSVLRVGDPVCARLWSVIEKAITPPPSPSTVELVTEADGSQTMVSTPSAATSEAAPRTEPPATSPSSGPAAPSSERSDSPT